MLSDPSYEAASSIYNWANWFLVGSLIFGAGSTGLIVWMGKVKERYSNEEIARANESAQLANERANVAEQRTIEARLEIAKEIERNTRPGLSREGYAAIQTLKGKVSEVNLLWSPASDAFWYAKDIEIALQQANIKVRHPEPPRDFWLTGISVYEPGIPAGEGPVYKAFKAGKLYPSGTSMPSFAKDFLPIPSISVGIKAGFLTQPSYFLPGVWNNEGKFQAGTWDTEGNFHPIKNE